MAIKLNNLKLARMRAGYTQKEVAERLGISESLVAKWETGRSRPRGDKLSALAELLAARPEELVDANAG